MDIDMFCGRSYGVLGMQVRFLDPSLDQLETDPAFDGGFHQAVVRAFRKKMQLIRAAPDERTFYAMKGLHFEKLKGDRRDDHSMRLNDQWRLIVRLEAGAQGKTVVVVGIEDYH
jgi:proteic killer suppression protein